MEFTSSYAVEIKNIKKLFNLTIKIFNQVVSFCIQAFESEWLELKDINDASKTNKNIANELKSEIQKFSNI